MRVLSRPLGLEAWGSVGSYAPSLPAHAGCRCAVDAREGYGVRKLALPASRSVGFDEVTEKAICSSG